MGQLSEIAAESLPLDGVRVLDLSRVLAGPLATMMLADLGAEVIKVERPDGGDETRGWGPPFDARGEAAYFLGVNRNKRSIALDFRGATDRALLDRLLEGADVVVENFLPGAMARLGLHPDEWLARCPSLVWCSIRGFPDDAARPGYDFVVQAESGWMAITGEPDGAPMKHGVALVDVITGKDAATAICAALAARAGRAPRSAAARHLVVTLAGSATAALVNVAQNVLVSGADAGRWGNAHANLVPYQLFQAADRPVVVAVGSDAQWQAAARVLGLEALAADPSLATNAGRLAQRARVVAAVADAISQRGAAEWCARLGAAGVPVGVVRPVGEVLAGVPGASPVSGMPSAVGGRVRRPPPTLDEHGAEIRAAGGWSQR